MQDRFSSEYIDENSISKQSWYYR